MIRHKSYFLGFLLCLSAFGQAVQQAATTTGALQGSVTDPQGAPLAGAVVHYQRVYQTVSVGVHTQRPVPAPGEAVTSGDATATSTGAFSVTSLPPGDYLLCAAVPATAYLDPCLWQSALHVTVSAGASTNQTIALTKGVFLNVRVNDPGGLLPKAVDGAFGSGIAVGVMFGKGAYLGAQNTSVDSAGRSYQIAVPAGTPLGVWTHSGKFSLSDSSGNVVPFSGAQVPFQASSGLDQAFTYSVTGIAAQPQPVASVQ